MDIEYRRALGQVLSAKRQAAKLSKRKLALMVGVCRHTIRAIEEGKSSASIETARHIAQGLGVSFADVIVECERKLAGVDAKERPPIPKPQELRTRHPETYYLVTRL